jgi:protein-L-isoaspartate(D-aspartate) O-methyltransferase
MTTEFSQRRLNMVNAQLATNGIHSEALIESYKTLPRESFVDEQHRAFVCMDEDISLGNGRWLLEPMIEAKMIQEAVRGAGARALFLGASNLPAAAMLSQFLKAITLVESDAAIASAARVRLADAGITNVAVAEGSYTQGFERDAPYDVIFVPGAVAAIAPALTAQLAVGGSLVCVLRENTRAQGRIVVARKDHDGAMTLTPMADASTPYLPGFEPAVEFVF